MRHLKIDKVIKLCAECVYCTNLENNYCTNPGIEGNNDIYYEDAEILDNCPLDEQWETISYDLIRRPEPASLKDGEIKYKCE